jgi:hypothetical protein
MREDLARTLAHLQAAGVHAAGAAVPRFAAARRFVSPPAAMMRDGWRAPLSTVSPLLESTRAQTRMANRAAARAGRDLATVRKWPLLVGGALAGAAAVGAYAARKRRNGRLSTDAVIAMVEDAEGIADAAVLPVAGSPAATMDPLAADRVSAEEVASAEDGTPKNPYA